MTMFLIQSAILLAIAFVIGTIVGCFLKRIFASDNVAVPVAATAVTTVTAAAAMIAKPAPAEAEPLAEPVRVLVPSAEPAQPASKALAKPAAKANAKTKPKTASKSDALGLLGSAPVASAKPAKSAAKPATPQAVPVKKPMAVKLAKPIGGKPDNLTLIDGIGNVLEKKLHALGVFHFEQMSNWSEDQAETFSKAIGFPGRAKREGWVKEATIFAKGGTTEHARKVETGQIKSSRVSTAAEKGGKKK